MLDSALQLIEDGGIIVFILFVIGAWLWTVIGARYWALRTRRISSVDRLKMVEEGGLPVDFLSTVAEEMHNAGAIEREAICSRYITATDKYKLVIQSLIVIAPLLGLLGTVSGMIETFKGLGQMSLYTQSGGIAGGIAEALLTTQVGLIVAAPATIASRLLERKADKIRSEIIELKTMRNVA